MSLRTKAIYAVVRLQETPRDRYLTARRARYRHRMELLGMREASIDKALRRGFKGPFHRAREREMERVIWDIKYARRTHAVVAEVPA